eukprot:202697-Ditylum_brightwellii.AAC.1
MKKVKRVITCEQHLDADAQRQDVVKVYTVGGCRRQRKGKSGEKRSTFESKKFQGRFDGKEDL